MKYKLTDETITHFGRTLHRIEALKDFGNVKAGDKGGYIERDINLSQSGNCWVYGNAKVYRNAEVYDNAKVWGNADVFGIAEVWGNASVYGNAKVWDNASVRGNASVYDNAVVSGNAKVYDTAEVWGNAKVSGNAKVYDTADVSGNTKVYGDAEVFGNAKVWGNASVYGNANICHNEDYIVFKNWWSSGRYFTWTRSNNMWQVGCFYGTGEKLIEKAYKDSETSGREYERIVKYVEEIRKKL